MPPFTPCGTFDLARRVPMDPARWEVAYGPANVQGAQHAAVGGAPPQQVGRYEYHGWVGEEPAPGVLTPIFLIDAKLTWSGD